MKKHCRLLISLLLLFLLLILPQDGHITAATIHEVSGDNAIIDSYYGFAPKFTPGVSWSEIYGCTNYSDSDLYRNSSANSGRLPRNSHVALLYNNDVVRSGTIGVRYNNVGYYNGSAIDLKIMLVGGEIRTASADKYPSSNVPGVAIMDNDIDIYQQSYHTRNLIWQFTFYQRGTNNTVSVPFHANFKDIDGTEFVDFSYGGITHAYVMSKASGGTLDYTSTRVSVQGDMTSTDDDKTHWTTLLGATSSFRLVYSRAKEQNYSAWDTPSNNRSFYHWKWSSDSLVRFDTPTPTKRINGNTSASIYDTTAYNYTIDFAVPPEDATTYYTSFKLNDTLANCLQLVNGASSITVWDSAGNDVTSKFNRSVSGQSIQLSLSNVNDASFYDKSYVVTMNCRKKSSYDMSAWFNTSGSGSVSNTASITTDRGTKTSNAVTVGFYYKVTTSVTNGTITASTSSQLPNTSKTVSYAPSSSDYELESVTIDGSAVNINSYPSSYTFSNVKDDHTINVKFKRVYKIDTSATGGTITSKITSIDKGEQRTITYTPNKGYYLRRLTVDGSVVDLKAYPTSYTFSNISADHTIKADFLPIPELRIMKRIYADEVYLPSGNPTFIFKIKGVDYLGNSHEYTDVIRFTKADLNGSDIIEKELIRKDIPAGSYEITEVSVSRYHLDSITGVVSGKVNGSKVTLDTDGQNARAIFVNRRTKFQDYSDNDFVINQFYK
ncbi:isopeptide-forming domain-containing fimbrial protein [[Clostridium] innocuum]|nr:isopeptide-forming domain-containing fimbrial protein [[Clostridium] innocuum]